MTPYLFLQFAAFENFSITAIKTYTVIRQVDMGNVSSRLIFRSKIYFLKLAKEVRTADTFRSCCRFLKFLSSVQNSPNSNFTLHSRYHRCHGYIIYLLLIAVLAYTMIGRIARE